MHVNELRLITEPVTGASLGTKRRAFAVTAGLAAAGALGGAALGAVLLLGWVVATPPGFGGYPPISEIIALGAAVGGGLGALALPALGWGSLRSVPLARAF